MCWKYFNDQIYKPGARFNEEVQLTLSLILNSELTYSEMGNFEFLVTEQLKWRSTEITMIHHDNSCHQKNNSARTSVNA